MRAVMYYGPDVPITVETIADPVPGPGELVLKVGRCGICGSDVHLTQEHGWMPVGMPLGHEFAGEVVAVGKDVEDFRLGDVVTALPAAGCGHCVACAEGLPMLCERPAEMTFCAGGFADYVRIVARTAVKLPGSLSMADGALVEPLSVSLHAVALANITPGARVLVLGAGSIGLGVAFWASKLGAGRIAVAARSSRRQEDAARIGADAFVLTGEGEVDAVRAALGASPDVVFECIGAVGGLGQAVEHVRARGTVVSLGLCTKLDPVMPAAATFKEASIRFSMAYSLKEFQFTADMLDRGHLEPRKWLGPAIPLEAVPDKILEMRQSNAHEVKVQVDPSIQVGSK